MCSHCAPVVTSKWIVKYVIRCMAFIIALYKYRMFFVNTKLGSSQKYHFEPCIGTEFFFCAYHIWDYCLFRVLLWLVCFSSCLDYHSVLCWPFINLSFLWLFKVLLCYLIPIYHPYVIIMWFKLVVISSRQSSLVGCMCVVCLFIS